MKQKLLSQKNKDVLFTPIGINNPVTVQVLGICSSLAVTAKLEPAIVMGLSVTIIMRTNNNIDRGGFPAPRFLHGKQNGIV